METLVTFLPMEAIGEDGTLDRSREAPVGDLIDGYTYFADGDVAFAKITPCFENGKGAFMSGLRNGVGFGTTELIVVRASDRVVPSYLHSVFSSAPFRGEGESRMYGAGGQKRVPEDFMRDVVVPMPPLEEQRGILSFLDSETAKVDALIAAQERLIALLQEKRQAVISHAVTKGLDPSVPMKDSGVEWIGEVPAHWSVSTIKRLGSIQYGLGEPPPYREVGYPLVRATDVDAGRLMIESAVRVDVADIPASRIVWLEPGDIIVVRSGAGTGDSGQFIGASRSAIAGFDMVLRPTRVDAGLLQWLLLSVCVLNAQIHPLRIRAAQPHLNAEELGRCIVPVPPIPEQVAIRAFLDKIVARLDLVAAEALAAVSLLRERRSALITAAVTGQIDVRGLVEPAA
jgi:type I restriction enzyme S subunit